MKYAGIYIWSGIDRIGTSAISFFCNIVLARILSTEDFGIVGMVAIFFSIAYGFTDCGLSDGLIKMNNAQKRDYGTAFLFNMLAGLIIAILFYILAIPASLFFEQSKLIIVIRLSGLALFLHALTFTEETRLRKNLCMKKLAIVKLISSLFASFFSIWIALEGGGYLALVYLQVFIPLCLLMGFTLITHWRPILYFDKQTFYKLWGFGHHLLISFFINQMGRNLNSFALGKTTTSNTVGLYTQAQKLQEVPMMIVDSIFCNTSYPILSNIVNRNEKLRFIKQLTSRVLIINILLFMFLYLAAPFLIRFCYGEKWNLAIPIFRVLLIVGLLTSVRNFIQTLLKSYGASKKIKTLALIEMCIQIFLLFFTLKSGVFVIIYGQITALIISIFLHWKGFTLVKNKLSINNGMAK